jgi:uncharacterized protein YndB with AHSA1/START domain
MPTLDAAAPMSAVFVRQSRVIRAPRSRVYDAWTQPEVLQQWFGGEGRCCPTAQLDVREGGFYRIEIQPTQDSSKGATAEGVYTAVEPNERLQFTWHPSFNPGEESLVTVTFADANGGTEVTILHEKITSDGAPGYTKGWSGSLEKLATLLAS